MWMRAAASWLTGDECYVARDVAWRYISGDDLVYVFVKLFIRVYRKLQMHHYCYTFSPLAL